MRALAIVLLAACGSSKSAPPAPAHPDRAQCEAYFRHGMELSWQEKEGDAYDPSRLDDRLAALPADKKEEMITSCLQDFTIAGYQCAMRTTKLDMLAACDTVNQ